MKVAISGSSGLIGKTLSAKLEEGGHQVVSLVRRPPASAAEIGWDPSKGLSEPDSAEGLDAIVHLAGANIGESRWSDSRKQLLRESRVDSTSKLMASLLKLERPPRRVLAASAIGYYGDRGDELLDERSTVGTGFLAELTADWEEASRTSSDFADRVYILRTGIVLSTEGGALAKMLTPFKLGAGGVIGSGDQYMSWISIQDEVAAIVHLLASDLSSGPVNLTAPAPVTNREFTKTLGKALGRPTIFPLPAFMVKTIFGEMGEDLLLGSTRVEPDRLEKDGFVFAQPGFEAALRTVLAG
jgi:uncharacterized protein (TIGR01777 family)